MDEPLSPDLLAKMNAYWRAANYLSVGQIYLFDNPDLIVACVVGDGEAETGPPATSWHSNKFLNSAHDGAVLPILHLNGYKIASPTVLARVSHEELDQLFRGYGYEPHFIEGEERDEVHQAMAATLDRVPHSMCRSPLPLSDTGDHSPANFGNVVAMGTCPTIPTKPPRIPI